MPQKTKEIIEPVTRIEGHAKISIHLNEEDQVEDARFHVTEFRAFEKFVEGRPLWEMPDMTSRICGICPVSHQLAAVKACDDLLGVEIPEAAKKLRELLHMGQIFQSHALSFFYLSSPDLLLGYDADPSKRNIKGLLEENPEVAKRGVKMRSFGQNLIEALGGKKVHPEFVIPGGVNSNLDKEKGEKILEESKPLIDELKDTIDKLNEIYQNLDQETLNYATYPTKYMGLVDNDNGLEHYDGEIRLVDEEGDLLEQIKSNNYQDIISERSKNWTYLKFPYYSEEGFEDGQYRVGPLGRLNAAETIETEEARKEWKKYKEMAQGKIQEKTIFYHYARLIEMLYCLEKIQKLLKEDIIYNGVTNVPTKPKKGEGIGVIEAPRGTLIHHYKADEKGMIQDANFIVATTHNNAAMNKGIKMAAEKYVEGPEIPEGVLNKIESVIRCYDPCLSCSTHALGQMPMEIELKDNQGEIIDKAKK